MLAASDPPTRTGGRDSWGDVATGSGRDLSTNGSDFAALPPINTTPPRAPRLPFIVQTLCRRRGALQALGGTLGGQCIDTHLLWPPPSVCEHCGHRSATEGWDSGIAVRDASPANPTARITRWKAHGGISADSVCHGQTSDNGGRRQRTELRYLWRDVSYEGGVGATALQPLGHERT